MHDRADALLREDALDQGAVGDVAFVEGHVVGDRAPDAVRKIVDHRNAPPGVLQREHGMATDIPGAAGDEDWNFAHGISALADELRPRQSWIDLAFPRSR